MYVVTVALDEPGSVVVFTSIWDPQHRVNRQGTTALGAIERDEPSLIAVVTTSQIEVELTILQEQIKNPVNQQLSRICHPV